MPSSRSSIAIRAALALADRPLVNIEVVTPRGLSRHIWKSLNPSRTNSIASRKKMEMVLASHLADQPGSLSRLFLNTVPALVTSILEDKEKGRSADWALQNAETNGQKAYAELFSLYESTISASGLSDEADMLSFAVQNADIFSEERHLASLVACAEVNLEDGYADLLVTLGNKSTDRWVVGSVESVLPETTAGIILSDWRRPEGQPTHNEETIRLIQATTRREEILSVLVDVAVSGTPLDDVELAFTDGSRYRSGLEAACDRFEIPYVSASRKEEARIDRLFLAYGRCVLDGFSPKSVMNLLRSKVLDPSAVGSDPYRLASDLDNLRLYPETASDSSLKPMLEKKAEEMWMSRSRLSSLISFLTRLDSFRQKGSIQPARFLTGFKKFITEFCPETFQPGDYEFWIENRMSTWKGDDLGALPLDWLFQRMEDGLLNNPSDAPESGRGVQLLDISQAGYGPRSKVWVLGLDDRASSGSASRKSHHLLDYEETRIQNSVVGLRYSLGELVRRIGSGLTLSVAAFEVADNQPLYPGAALLDLKKIRNIEPESRNLTLDEADSGRLDAEALNSFYGAQRGRKASEMRAAEEWSEFDGIVDVDKNSVSTRFSPSRLETLSRCPHRYFLSNILRLDVPPEDDKDWMNAGETGTLLHGIFEDHARERIENKAGLSAEDEQQVLEQLRLSITDHAATSSGSSTVFQQQKYEELAVGVEQYFARERELEGFREPIKVEYSFGARQSDDHPPVALGPEGSKIMVTGRVDRIDKTQHGDLVIVDYKTGKPDSYEQANLLKLQDQLQWAVYALAAEKALSKQVEASEYFFTSSRGAGRVISASVADAQEVRECVQNLASKVSEGAFVQAAKEDNGGPCQWCDYKRICGNVVARREELKVKAERSFEHDVRQDGEQDVDGSSWFDRFIGWQYFPKNKP